MKLRTLIVPILLLAVVVAAIYIFTRQTTQSSAISANNLQNDKDKSSDEKFDACKLISNAEIEAVQGEPVQDAKSNSRNNNSLLVSQCFYQLKTYSKSISIEVTKSAGENSKNNIKEIWEKKFKTSHAKDEDREEEEAESDEKEASQELRSLPNLGEEAFLVGNSISEALYILNKNTIIRISIGGNDKDEVKSEKLKTLAQKILKKI